MEKRYNLNVIQIKMQFVGYKKHVQNTQSITKIIYDYETLLDRKF